MLVLPLLLRRKETTGQSALQGPLTLWVVKGEVKISLAHNSLWLGNLPTGRGTTAHFPINTIRHPLSPAYLLLALKSPELGPRDSQLRPASPLGPDLARDWSLWAVIPAPSPSVTAKMASVAAAVAAAAEARAGGGGSGGRKGRGSPV